MERERWRRWVKKRGSEIMEVVFEVFEGHFVFVYFGVLETVFHLIQSYILVYGFEHCDDILGIQVPFFLSVQLVEQEEQLFINIRLLQSLVQLFL